MTNTLLTHLTTWWNELQTSLVDLVQDPRVYVALIAFVVLFIVLRLGVRTLAAVAGQFGKDQPTSWGRIFAEVLKKTNSLVLIIVAAFITTLPINLPASLQSALEIALYVGLIYQFALWLSRFFTALIERQSAVRMARDGSTSNAVTLLQLLVRIIVWSVALLMVLDNLGVNVTALVAGLGIGGIAIGLAAQGIISDLFGSFTILLDKPFETGDFIIFGDMMGTVERIGINSTRVRSLSGEQIVISNADLLSTRIRNFKRMQERRVLFSFGVTYQTPAEKLERIPGMVRAAIEGQEGTRFDRSHFARFGASSLDFENVYYVLTSDYNTFMDIQQRVNLSLCRTFEAEGIEFAYPTQTLYVSQQ